jgi:hypothetical protein
MKMASMKDGIHRKGCKATITKLSLRPKTELSNFPPRTQISNQKCRFLKFELFLLSYQTEGMMKDDVAEVVERRLENQSIGCQTHFAQLCHCLRGDSDRTTDVSNANSNLPGAHRMSPHENGAVRRQLSSIKIGAFRVLHNTGFIGMTGRIAVAWK